MSLEDIVKPYLILTKSFQFQIDSLKNKSVLDKERIERLEKLKDLILNQMLLQIKLPDLGLKLDEEGLKESKNLAISELINTLKLDTLESIKQKLEEAEKQIK